MTIYVRTQDKSKMFEISSVSYEEKQKTSRTVLDDNIISETVESRHTLFGNNKPLGEYSSKERCLQIMTEIQNTIANHTLNTTIVYNMPEI